MHRLFIILKTKLPNGWFGLFYLGKEAAAMRRKVLACSKLFLKN